MNNPGNRGGRGPAGGEGEIVTRVRTPKESEGEILGTATSMLGANRIVVRCVDGVTRMCRIPGKMKKRIWIREGDVVTVENHSTRRWGI